MTKLRCPKCNNILTSFHVWTRRWGRDKNNKLIPPLCDKCKVKDMYKKSAENKKRLENEREKEKKVRKEKQERIKKNLDRLKEEEKAEKILDEFLLKNNLMYKTGLTHGEYVNLNFDYPVIFHKKDTKKQKYPISREFLIDLIIKNNYTEDIGELFKQLSEEIEYQLEINKIKERERKIKIKERAEKKVYGKVKTKRLALSEDEKEGIFAKFNRECSICGAKEGLHIHHKNQDPKDNKISNLTVLCGVCHKKIHMKVR